MSRAFILGAACLVFLGACGAFEPNIAVLWTDRPEFAIYAEYFNSSQDQYKIEVRYYPSVAQKL
ncbi:MAG: hypothetical protein LBU21_01140, partial [Treponema sp.]|nr:hypothetical protein [Treponema sp.]